MFRRIKNRLLTIEVVLDVMLALLHRKGLITQDEIQLEILSRSVAGRKRAMLSELPAGSKVYGYAFSDNEEKVVITDHLEGETVKCHLENEEDKTFYLSGNVAVKKFRDGWKEL